MDSFGSSCWSVASQSVGCILCSSIVIQVSFTTEMGYVCDKAGMFHSTYKLIGLLSSPEAHLFSLHLGSSAFQYYELSAILYTLRSHKLQTSKAFPTIEARSRGNKSSQNLPKSLQALYFYNYLIIFVSAFCTKRLTTFWQPLFSVFFKDELIHVVASSVGQLNLLSERMDFPKPSPEEAAERDNSLLKLVPPQALVYPTESNPLRIFVSRSWLSQRT